VLRRGGGHGGLTSSRSLSKRLRALTLNGTDFTG
jgi:hypothetical protein